MKPDDAELISRYLQGDNEAVTAIEDWINGAAQSYSRRLGGLWDDVVQEARLEVYRLLQGGEFRGEAKLKTYLWQVVNHTFLDAVRSQTKWQWTELDECGQIVAISTQRARERASALEVTDLVLKVLEEVPADCKRIWRLILRGYSYREISRLLSVTESALRVRALRCRKRAEEIRRRLETRPSV